MTGVLLILKFAQQKQEEFIKQWQACFSNVHLPLCAAVVKPCYPSCTATGFFCKSSCLDTFEKSKKERVFYIGTNNPDQLTMLRKKILSNFSRLPDMGEYIHRSYFDGSDKYCKDTFLFIKYFGTSFLPRLFNLKSKIRKKNLYYSIKYE